MMETISGLLCMDWSAFYDAGFRVLVEITTDAGVKYASRHVETGDFLYFAQFNDVSGFVSDFFRWGVPAEEARHLVCQLPVEGSAA